MSSCQPPSLLVPLLPTRLWDVDAARVVDTTDASPTLQVPHGTAISETAPSHIAVTHSVEHLNNVADVDGNPAPNGNAALTAPDSSDKDAKLHPVLSDFARRVAADGGYVAVSHAWGEILEEIEYPGVPWKFRIKSREKMDTILKVAKAMGVKWLWMDVLCVKQDDLDDKKREVPRMGAVYSQSSKCIVILSDPKMSAREKLFRERNCLARASSITMIGDEGAGASTEAKEVCTIVCDLFMDDWFWRVWTYQEAILPKTHIMVTELGSVLPSSIDDWLNAALILQSRYSHSYPGFIVGGRRSPAGELYPSNRSFASVHHLAIVRNHRVQDGVGFFPLAKVVAGIAHRVSMNEDDRLFGILGILSYGKWLQMVKGEPFWRSWLRLAELGVTAGDLSLLSFKRCMNTGPTDQDARPVPVSGEFSYVPCRWFGVFSNGGAPVGSYQSKRSKRHRSHPYSRAFSRLVPFSGDCGTAGGNLPPDRLFPTVTNSLSSRRPPSTRMHTSTWSAC
ncbi:heterokaryon incompatibility protein-domain-containing protein [Zopfochytrium polystomum]|nr:heterokaryon incompatibility protein-domain-containing protein [Zopfochytrium polystomum]